MVRDVWQPTRHGDERGECDQVGGVATSRSTQQRRDEFGNARNRLQDNKAQTNKHHGRIRSSGDHREENRDDRDTGDVAQLPGDDARIRLFEDPVVEHEEQDEARKQRARE